MNRTVRLFKLTNHRQINVRNVRKYSRNIMRLHERGMFQDVFPNNAVQDIIDLCNIKPQCVYAGFDPTAPSLHVGNLLVLINLMHWQRGGHQAILLVGGATGRVGDPSGRSRERDAQSCDVVIVNASRISSTVQRLFSNHEQFFCTKTLPAVKVLNNMDWWSRISAVDFLCETGRHFRMGDMLARSSVAKRKHSLSFLELSYQVMQAYDWLKLKKDHNCSFQVGGSDQMGNIAAGHELISRVIEEPVYGLTLPLITSETGDKYGKSGGNAVWLESDMTSTFDLYQFFIRTPDSAVEKFLKLLTFLPLGEIDQFMQKHTAEPEKRVAQQVLAQQIVKLVHGEEGLKDAERATKLIYGGMTREALGELKEEEIISTLRGQALVVSLLMQPAITVRDLALSAKCFLNLEDAERIIRAGGFYINQERIKNPDEVVLPGVHILPNLISLLRVGKKNYWIVKWMQ